MTLRSKFRTVVMLSALAAGGCASDDVSAIHDGAVPPELPVAAAGLTGLSEIVMARDGDLFAVLRHGQILRFKDIDQDGRFDDTYPERFLWAVMACTGARIAFNETQSFLYASACDRAVRYVYCGGAAAGGQPEVVAQGTYEWSATPTLSVTSPRDGTVYVADTDAGTILRVEAR